MVYKIGIGANPSCQTLFVHHKPWFFIFSPYTRSHIIISVFSFTRIIYAFAYIWCISTINKLQLPANAYYYEVNARYI